MFLHEGKTFLVVMNQSVCQLTLRSIGHYQPIRMPVWWWLTNQRLRNGKIVHWFLEWSLGLKRVLDHWSALWITSHRLICNLELEHLLILDHQLDPSPTPKIVSVSVNQADGSTIQKTFAIESSNSVIWNLYISFL